MTVPLRIHPHSDVLRTIGTLADAYGAKELWLFGSTVAAVIAEPNDIDLAILGFSADVTHCLASDLQRRFPGCRVEAATQYTTGSVDRCGRRPLHFTLAATGDEEFERHAIARSIRRGTLIWSAQ